MSRRIIMWAQRRARIVPPPARDLARRILSPILTRGVELPSEDWTVPLVSGRGGRDLEALAGTPVRALRPDTPTASAPSHGRELHCVVAIDHLDVGGMDEFVAFLGRRLPSLGIRTTVAYGDTHIVGFRGTGGRLQRVLEAAGVPTVQVSPDRAADWLREVRPDVISSHCAPDWLLAAAVKTGVPWVETLHGLHQFLHPESWRPERERARDITAHVAVSELVRRQYLTVNPEYPPDRVITVPNGFDETRITEVDRDHARAALGLTDEFLFVSLARYSLQKNAFGLVTAFAEMAKHVGDAHLLFAGRADDPAYYAQVSAHARQQHCADRIHLRGHCMNAAALLAAADAFVLDSYFEGWPLATMEALGTGLPVVMADVGGAIEQLAGDRRGILVTNPAGHPEAVNWRTMSETRFAPQVNQAELVAALSRLATDRADWAAVRRELGAEARAAFPAANCLAGHAAVLRGVVYADGVPEPRAVNVDSPA